MTAKSSKIEVLVALQILYGLATGCYVFRDRDTGAEGSTAGGSAVVGHPLGNRAGAVDWAALDAIHALASEHPPAAIRPDPDRFARRLLLQYRSEGSVVARQIGAVEQYRLLLGGANDDFSKMPQLTYDATSLLAAYTVSETLCRALVAPDASNHEGWSTILPNPPDAVAANLRFLAARMLGQPSSGISDAVIGSLESILDAGRTGATVGYEDYVVPCATLLTDAEAMLL